MKKKNQEIMAKIKNKKLQTQCQKIKKNAKNEEKG